MPLEPLTLAGIETIVRLMVGDSRARLDDRQMRRELTEHARRSIAGQGFDPAHGARPLRRFTAREVETWIGRAPLSGDIADGATIWGDATDGQPVVRRHDAAGAQVKAA